jgi:hypothetical protein
MDEMISVSRNHCQAGPLAAEARAALRAVEVSGRMLDECPP